MKNKPNLKRTFYSLIIIFILILAFFLLPDISIIENIQRKLFLLAAVLGLIFLIQGTRLAFIARKEKGLLKIFLMLTGIAALAPLPFSILHNAFYALAIVFENFEFLFEVLHVASFIIALAVAPITFIVGVIGSLIIFHKNKKEVATS